MRVFIGTGLIGLILAVAGLAACAHDARRGEKFRDCADCPEMVVIPAGDFTMGSPAIEMNRGADEGPQRRITFERAFAVGRSEVTRSQYAAFTRATGHVEGMDCYTGRFSNGQWERDPNASWREPGFAQGDDHPVVCVSWEDAQAFVQWLNTQAGGGYRLLSEAEWEYAARAGATSAYPWGDVASHEHANYGADVCCSGIASGRDLWEQTSPEGSFPANDFGLSDMIGNVWEWTQDCYETSLAAVPSDGSASEMGDCSGRVDRGGSWHTDPQYIRPAARRWLMPADRASYIGFRVAKTLPE